MGAAVPGLLKTWHGGCRQRQRAGDMAGMAPSRTAMPLLLPLLLLQVGIRRRGSGGIKRRARRDGRRQGGHA